MSGTRCFIRMKVPLWSVKSAVAALAFPLISLAAQSSGVKITGARALPFYEGVAKLGSQDLLTGRFALFNVPGRTVDLDGPSSFTLVLVRVERSSEAFDRALGPRVVLKAMSEGQKVFEQSVALGTLTTIKPGSATWVPFLLSNTGCQPLQLEAHLVVKGQAGTATPLGEIPFRCGE